MNKPPERIPVIKRKFAYIGAGWLSGLAVFLNTGKLCAFSAAAAGIVLSAAAVFLPRSRGEVRQKRRYAAKHLLMMSCAALAAVLFFDCHVSRVYAPLTSLDGSTVTITGVVTDEKTTSGGNTQLTVSGRISGRRAKVILNAEGFSCGDGIRAVFKAKQPENSLTFDAEDYYRSSGVYLISSGKVEAVKTDGGSSLIRAVRSLRESTLSRIYESCGGESGAVIAAMLCADKSHLTQRTSSAIYRAGIGHLFAVSGTHIVIIVSFLAMLIRVLPVSQRLSSVISIAVTVLFALFAGFTPSVVRAALMMSVSLIAVFFNRHGDSANSLGMTAVIITLAEPFAITSVSFQLSFIAAASFGVLSPALLRGRVRSPAVKYAVSCICVSVLTLPVCAVHFSEVSLISAAVNLLMIPLCTLCLCIAFLFMLTGGVFAPLLTAADFIAGVIISVCRAVTVSPLTYAGTYYSGLFAVWGVIGSAVFIGAALAKKRRAADIMKCAGVYLLICVLAAYIGAEPMTDRLVVYPAENGAAVLVIAGRDSLIYDLGAGGKTAYPIARMTERVHSGNVCIFVSGSGEAARKTADKYSKCLAEEPCLTAESGQLKGGVTACGVLTEQEKSGFGITINGIRIILANNEIIMGDKTIKTSELKNVTEIMIKK